MKSIVNRTTTRSGVLRVNGATQMAAKRMARLRAIVGIHTVLAALLLLTTASRIAVAQDIPIHESLDNIPGFNENYFGGPGSIAFQLQSDIKPKNHLFDTEETEGGLFSFSEFKERIQKDYGLTFGADYNMLWQHASKSLGEENAASGALRFFGSWSVLDEESGSPGSIEFKLENRHRLGTEIAPQALGGEFGYAGLTTVTYSAADSLLTNFYWRQSNSDNSFGYVAGIVDVTDYVSVYGLVNPWADFINLMFSTDPTIPAPDQGLGTAVLWGFSENLYMLAGIADANADPGDPLNSIEKAFEEQEFFKHLEVGWYGSWDTRIEDNIHLTIWQVDERTDAGVDDGWGAAFSYSKKINDRWLPFLRIGYADGSGALLERSVSAGLAYYSANEQGVLGLGINWGRPNRDIFSGDVRDQHTLEAYYRLQLLKDLVITPDVQMIKDPATNPDDDLVWVAGLRVRFSF